MQLTLSLVALGLLELSSALETVTVRINTGTCPATSSTLASVSASSTTTSTTANAANPTIYSRSPCPASIGQAVDDQNGDNYQLFCQSAIIGSDIKAVNAVSLAECLDQCDDYTPAEDGNGNYCVAVTYFAAAVDAGNCQLKYDIQNVQWLTSSGDSARLSSFDVSPAISSSIGAIIYESTAGLPAATSTGSSSAFITGSISPSASATITGSINPSASATITDSISTSASASSSISSTASESRTAAPLPTQLDGTQGYYTQEDGPGYPYDIICNRVAEDIAERIVAAQNGGPSDGGIFTDTFDACLDACDLYADPDTNDPCSVAAYTSNTFDNAGNNCFFTTNTNVTIYETDVSCLAIVPGTDVTDAGSP